MPQNLREEATTRQPLSSIRQSLEDDVWDSFPSANLFTALPAEQLFLARQYGSVLLEGRKDRLMFPISLLV